MTSHVLTIVNPLEILSKVEPKAFMDTMSSPAWAAIDVRLRGGFGTLGTKPVSGDVFSKWSPLVSDIVGRKPVGPSEIMLALATKLGIERWGHGWIEAKDRKSAEREAVACAADADRFRVVRWGSNGEIGWFGRPVSNGAKAVYRKGSIEDAVRFARVFRGITGVFNDWMGFGSIRWVYGHGAPEFTPDDCNEFDMSALMVYQSSWDGRFGAKETIERGNKIWRPQSESGGMTYLIGCGRWEDRDKDGIVDRGEVVGDLTTTKNIVSEFNPYYLRHYVGNGAWAQIAEGNVLYPSMGKLVRMLQEGAA